MLSKIRDYIRKSDMVSHDQLQREFGLSLSSLEPILDLLIQRHEIRKIEGELCSKRCQDCQGPIYYEWIEKH